MMSTTSAPNSESPLFSNIRLVLVEPSHPGNIGAVARAMKNMCLEQLYLVAPRSFPHAEASARASGADDVLAHARLCASLGDAIQDCSLVIGTSARPRTIAWPQVAPRTAARLAVSQASTAPVALLFGRERVGLTNEELEYCHYVMQIPANPTYSSLNIAAAVQILAYEILLAGNAPEAAVPLMENPQVPASAQDMENFMDHLRLALVGIEFLDPKNPRQLMRRLRRLFNRARPDTMELNILRGILTAIQNKCR